jgi:hypothetical protein
VPKVIGRLREVAGTGDEPQAAELLAQLRALREGKEPLRSPVAESVE